MPDIEISQDVVVTATRDPSSEIDVGQQVQVLATRDPSAEINFTQDVQVLATKAPTEILFSQFYRVVVTRNFVFGNQESCQGSVIC